MTKTMLSFKEWKKPTCINGFFFLVEDFEKVLFETIHLHTHNSDLLLRQISIQNKCRRFKLHAFGSKNGPNIHIRLQRTILYFLEFFANINFVPFNPVFQFFKHFCFKMIMKSSWGLNLIN